MKNMNDLKTFDIKTPITDSVIELFEKMLSMEVELTDETSQPGVDGQKITVSLSLAGELMGGINIQVSETFAHLMTAAMLGMDADEIESKEEINDVLLEACNIIGGNLNSNLCDSGFSVEISTPYITSGNDFQIETLNMERYESFAFRHREHIIIVEVCMKLAGDEEPDTERQLTRIDLSKFKRLDIIASTGDSVIELFDTMLSMEVELSDEAAEAEMDGPQTMGSVNFAGDVMGSVNIQVSDIFARLISAAMLGMDLEEIEDKAQIKDVIGEVTNIIAGNLKSGFCDSGLTCEISPPSITSGNDFKTETVNMDRYERFAFHYEGNNIFVEVCVKIDENSYRQEKMKSDANDTVVKQIPAKEESQQSIDDFIAAEISAGVDTSAVDTSDTLENEVISEDTLCEANEQLMSPDGSVDNEEIDDAVNTGLNGMNIDLILDVPVEISVELGQTKKKINELLSLGQGSILEFSNLAGEPVDILVNQILIARGDVVVEKEKYGIRVLEISSQRERIEGLR
jgi:flagellar motor switch protein FliN/FliY